MRVSIDLLGVDTKRINVFCVFSFERSVRCKTFVLWADWIYDGDRGN